MRYDLQDGGRFEVQPGRGLVGGDLECDATLVPGMCALDNIRQVSRVCNTNRTDCDAVVLYYAGACTRVVNRCAWRERGVPGAASGEGQCRAGPAAHTLRESGRHAVLRDAFPCRCGSNTL